VDPLIVLHVAAV